jgi:hypothetical protein
MDVGRPRTRPPGETTTLSFKAEPKLLEALDAEAERMSAEQPPGRAKLSRTEMIKIALFEWLAARAKARSERKQ